MAEKNKIWTVYTHTSPSGKVYVGISKDLKNRWANKGMKYCTYKSIFRHAIAKYGWGNIKHAIVLDKVSKSEAVYAEKYLIRWYKIHNLSYNITDGGEGTLGIKFSKERIQHMKEGRAAKNASEYLIIDKNFNYRVFSTIKEAAEYLGGKRENISHLLKQPLGYTFREHYAWRHLKDTPINIRDIQCQIQTACAERSKKVSEKTKSRVEELVAASKAERAHLTKEQRKERYTSNSKGMAGKHHTKETKEKMSNVARGRDMRKAVEAAVASRKAKAIPLIVTKNKEFIGEFPQVSEAAKALSISKSSIYRALKGACARGFSINFKKEAV